MKIAIPVKDESLVFFGNAGHTPKFTIFDMNGAGMFRSFKLENIINNPRTDLEHEHEEDEHHQCSHGHDDAEHVAQHVKMGVALQDCDYLVVSRACKNTVNSMKQYDIKVMKYNGSRLKGDEILRELSGKFI
jgi:predicted Fe-Mo cluster-binding NifX family protein